MAMISKNAGADSKEGPYGPTEPSAKTGAANESQSSSDKTVETLELWIADLKCIDGKTTVKMSDAIDQSDEHVAVTDRLKECMRKIQRQVKMTRTSRDATKSGAQERAEGSA